VRAIVSDAFLAQLGWLKIESTWILFEQVNYDQYGEPIIYSKDYHRGDAITFRVSRYRPITSS
jgi:DNA-binding GntR family transcriptional regulator